MKTTKNLILGFLLTFSFISLFGQTRERLKVACWNIEHLRPENDQGAVKRNDDDYLRLKKYGDRLDADVIALQEVDGEEAARRVFDPDRYNFFFSNRNNVMRTGFAVRKDLEVIRHPDFIDLDIDGSGNLRFGTDITVISGDDSLRLMSVHLKSRCFQTSLSNSNSRDCAKLIRQLHELEEWIDSRSEESIPFIVLGDFNRRMNIPGDEFWMEIDDGVPINSDLHKVTEGRVSDCLNGRYPEYIDHIVLDKRATEILDISSFEQLVFDEEDDPFLDKLSDHCPIAVDVVVGDFPPCPDDLVIQLDKMQNMVDSLQLLIGEIRRKSGEH